MIDGLYPTGIGWISGDINAPSLEEYPSSLFSP
jgi:hypothetical protein